MKWAPLWCPFFFCKPSADPHQLPTRFSILLFSMKYLLDGQETERLHFRKLQPDDFSGWLEFFRNPKAIRFWNYQTTDPEQLCKNWFTKTFERYEQNTGGMNILLDKHTGELIGQAGLCIQIVDDQEELEIGYFILPKYWNFGFASEAALCCKEYAFENNFSETLISIIHENNIGSQQAAIRNGMSIEKSTIYAGNPVLIFRIEKTHK